MPCAPRGMYASISSGPRRPPVALAQKKKKTRKKTKPWLLPPSCTMFSPLDKNNNVFSSLAHRPTSRKHKKTQATANLGSQGTSFRAPCFSVLLLLFAERSSLCTPIPTARTTLKSASLNKCDQQEKFISCHLQMQSVVYTMKCDGRRRHWKWTGYKKRKTRHPPQKFGIEFQWFKGYSD